MISSVTLKTLNSQKQSLGGCWGLRGWGDVGQRVQTFNYKVNISQGSKSSPVVGTSPSTGGGAGLSLGRGGRIPQASWPKTET